MSKPFYFGDPSDSDDDADTLPYPEPLARSSFLEADFTPTKFLSSLQNRHQTLEDLRTELRDRSQELSKELLDLVNDNYQEFLGLGNDLRGGDQKVEEVRVGLLGFRRELDALREATEARRHQVEELVGERRQVKQSLRLGKDLIEVDTRLDEIEEALGITGKPGNQAPGSADSESSSDDLSADSDDSDDEDNTGTAALLSRLTRRVQQFNETKRLARRAGLDHPFIVKQQVRFDKVKQTLLLDLASALQQCQRMQVPDRVLAVLQLYQAIGEPREAISAARAQVQAQTAR